MSEQTARHALPLLQPGQAQKEMWHNEALALTDALLHPLAEGVRDEPPEAPEPGECWIVGVEPAGDWAGQAGAIACWTAGGWRFAGPREGMTVWLRDAGCTARRGPADWEVGAIDARVLRIGGEQVIGSRSAAIGGPAGGATVDIEARTVINALLDALRTHGLIAH